MENIFLILSSLNLLALILTMFFLSKTMKTYGGKIGKGLNLIGLGVFGIAVQQIFTFLQVMFALDVLGEIFTNQTVYELFFPVLNLLVFILLAYGFYVMSSVLSSVSSGNKAKK